MRELPTLEEINERGELLRKRAERERQSLRRSMQGTHTTEEIQNILGLQRERCIYCNRKFTKRIRPTRDHILAVAYGGTNWGLNIVLACRSCNSRRSHIPFRTYCRLLSRAQNRRIVAHLKRRLLALEDSCSNDALRSFRYGLDLHEPTHSRYLMIQRDFPHARRNAATNPLLPRVGALVRSLSEVE